jgi:two-component system chemotaxis sensor kinase CheA
MEATAEVIDAALKSCDCCTILLQLDSADLATPVPLEAQVLEALRPFLPEMDAAAAKKSLGSKSATAMSRFKITFRPNLEVFFSGADPASLLLELADLGSTKVRCETSELLDCEEFNPELCYLQWEIHLETTQPEESIRAVFQFMEDDCHLLIEREQLAVSSLAEGREERFRGAVEQCFFALNFALEQCQSGDERQGLTSADRAANTLMSACKAHGQRGALAAVGQILASIQSIRDGGILDSGWHKQMQLLIKNANEATEVMAEDSTPIVEDTPHPSAVVKVANVQEAAGGTPAQSIRVDAVKLNALMRLAGELLVARGALPAFAGRLERNESPKGMAKEMRDAGAKVSRLADDLQATVMSIRMMPVRQVFQRFPRLVRDLGRTLDKSIELHISGEETEIDKTVIESIGDPLTHIIRNAADHGIESKLERSRCGKSETGRIDLSAYTRGSNVVIEVKDDGKGLDADKLKQRAVEKGLYSASAVAAMDQQTAFKIILAAGFSTLDKVTDLSGRGVGMDVVRNSVEALRGAIHIESEIGKGTRFRIELPASLLVSRGILVALSGQQVVLPMESISKMVKLPKAEVRTVQGQEIAHMRGAIFPILHLADALCAERTEDVKDDLAVVLIEATSGSYGLVVDRFVGEVEVVATPLSGVLATMPEYVGAAIMGDGKTVLVVNTERLFSLQRSPMTHRSVLSPAVM